MFEGDETSLLIKWVGIESLKNMYQNQTNYIFHETSKKLYLYSIREDDHSFFEEIFPNDPQFSPTFHWRTSCTHSDGQNNSSQF